MTTTAADPLARMVAVLAGARDRRTNEVTIQATIHQLLLLAELTESVELEVKVGLGRIDIEAGPLIIEVKRDLRGEGVTVAAVQQVVGYMRTRQYDGRRRVGIVTDGATWAAFSLDPGTADPVRMLSELHVRGPADRDRLLAWLRQQIRVTRQGLASGARPAAADPLILGYPRSQWIAAAAVFVVAVILMLCLL